MKRPARGRSPRHPPDQRRRTAAQPGPGRDLAIVAGGAGLGIAGKAARNGINFLFIVVLARWLELDALEGYFLALGIVMVSSQLALVGLDRGVVKYVSLFTTRGDRGAVRATIRLALLSGLGAGAAAASIVAVAVFAFDLSVGATEVGPGILRIMVWALPLHVALQIALAATRGFKFMRFTTMAEDFTLPLANLGLFLLIFALTRQQVQAVAFSHLGAVALATLLALAFLAHLTPAGTGRGTAGPVAGPLFKTSIPLAVAGLAGYTYAWLGMLVLGYTGGAGDVSVYQLSLRTTFLLVVLSMPVNQMLAPVMSAMYAEGRSSDLAQTYRTVSRWIFSVGAPLALAMGLFAPEWLHIFGSEYAWGASSLVLLAAATLLNACTGPSFWLLQMTGRHRAAMATTLLFVAAHLLLVLLLSRTGGARGAALGTGLSVLLFFALLVSMTYREFRFHPFAAALRKPLLALAGSAIAGYLVGRILSDLTGTWVFVRLAAGCLAIAAVYCAILLALGLEPSDRELISRARAGFASGRWRGGRREAER